MGTRDLTGVFLLNPANRDFVEGKARYAFVDITGRASVLSGLAKVALVAGVLAALGAAGMYLSQENAKAKLLASVRSVTASVSGCEGPGHYQHIRFHYTVDSVPYDESAFWQQSIFRGPSGLTDSCATGTVRLNYLAGAPKRWAIAPLSPIKREELEGSVSAGYVAAGPALLLLAGIFGLAAWAMRKRQATLEKLRDFGTILEGQLVTIKEDDGEGSVYSLICEYTFRNSHGIQINGSSGGFHGGLKKKDFPAPGTKLLVLYVNDGLHEAL